jgi:hypothetical protein
VPTFGGVPGVPGIVRAFARFDDGTGEALYFTCSVGGAALSEDWNAFMSTHASALGQPIAAGAHVWAQAWFRDPPAPKTTNLSDGLVFVVGP